MSPAVNRLAEAISDVIAEAVARALAANPPAQVASVVSPIADDRLQVTMREAASLLAFDQATVRRMIKRGDLVATGHGQSRRVTMASLRAYTKA